LQRAQKSGPEEGIVVHAYLDFDEDVGEGVGEGDVAEGLQAVPDLLRGGDVGADADAGEAALEPTISCNRNSLSATEHPNKSLMVEPR
jgi:hypothetical protein